MMWKRATSLALAIAFIAFLGWMLALGQYGTLAFGLGVLAGSFAAHWLSSLELPVAGFWAAALGLLALVVVAVSLPSGSTDSGLWVLSTSFISGAGLFGFLFLLINRYGPPRGQGRESVGG